MVCYALHWVGSVKGGSPEADVGCACVYGMSAAREGVCLCRRLLAGTRCLIVEVHRRRDITAMANVGVMCRSITLPSRVRCGLGEAALAGLAGVAAKGLWHGTIFFPYDIPASVTTWIVSDTTKPIVRAG